jgi:hypothetical protein
MFEALSELVKLSLRMSLIEPNTALFRLFSVGTVACILDVDQF